MIGARRVRHLRLGCVLALVVVAGCAGPLTEDAAPPATTPPTTTSPPATTSPTTSTTISESTSTQVEFDPEQGCPVEYPPQETSPYVLPYPVGDAYQIGLDNCSASFHGPGSPDQFAIDFDMPIGADIVAIRSGTVVNVYDADVDYSGTPGGNLVAIDHGDGTTAVYLHFTGGGVDVALGDEVSQSQVIGQAGASGTNAGYPHLHLIVIESPFAYPWEGLPVTFANTDPNPRGPVSGLVYEAQ